MKPICCDFFSLQNSPTHPLVLGSYIILHTFQSEGDLLNGELRMELISSILVYLGEMEIIEERSRSCCVEWGLRLV